MTTSPRFEPTDAYDLLALVADPDHPVSRDDARAFLDACRRDAMAHDGLVSVNRVRSLLADADIDPRRLSAFWSHFTGKGRPMVRAEGWEVCTGSTSGNDGRPFRLRRWVGEQS